MQNTITTHPAIIICSLLGLMVVRTGEGGEGASATLDAVAIGSGANGGGILYVN